MRVLLLLLLATPLLCSGQEQEFINVVKDLLQGDELKTFQNAYSSLPLELRDKLTKDLLSNPGKLGKDIMNLMGPQVQNLINSFGGFQPKKPASSKTSPESNEVDVEVDEMQMQYDPNANPKKKTGQQGGLDFGPLGSMLGNLISTNPQMLMTMVQGLVQGNGGQGGFSFETIMSSLTQQFDFDTLMSMASMFTGSGSSGSSRGEGGKQQGKGIAEMLQLQQITKMWTDFATSPVGQKVNRVVPRLLKAESLPEALRIVEKETAFRFDMVLRQFQDPTVRKMFVAQLARPIGQFFKGMKVPTDFKKVMARADEVFSKMEFAATVKEYADPVTQYIRETFKITKESLLDLSPEDIEKIASDVLNKEVLQPLTYVYDAYQKARENSICAKFVFCQLNRNFYNENFIRRHVIKTASIISAFQASEVMKKDAFSGLYESIHTGAEGFDCTTGQSNFCLELMHTTSHNEL